MTVSGLFDSKILDTNRHAPSIGWSKHICNENGRSIVICPSKMMLALSIPGVLRMSSRKRLTVVKSAGCLAFDVHAVPEKTFRLACES